MSACADIPFVLAAQAEDRACTTPPSRHVHRGVWRDGLHSSSERPVPEETPVAMVYDGSTYAVMMATPEDLEDFAIGFSLTEGVVRAAADIKSIDLVRSRDGVELRMWLAGSNSQRLRERRRRIAGPTGCGLCGIESLAESIRPAETVGDGLRFTSGQIMAAMQSIPPLQTLNIETRSVHAARSDNLLPASLPCGKTLAATKHWTSSLAHFRGMAHRSSCRSPHRQRWQSAWRMKRALRWPPSRGPTDLKSSHEPIEFHRASFSTVWRGNGDGPQIEIYDAAAKVRNLSSQ